MEANELMIGDWVKFTNSDLCHKIYAIQGKSVKIDKQYWHKASTMQPVPLTAEIIDKNFPKGKDNDNIKEWYFDDNITHMFRAWFHHIGNAPDIGMSIKVAGKGEMAVLLRYVHELQHALRLLGIEKEIEI